MFGFGIPEMIVILLIVVILGSVLVIGYIIARKLFR